MKVALSDFQVVLLAETPTAWRVRRAGGAYPALWIAKEDVELYEPDAAGVRQLTVEKASARRLGLSRNA